MSYRIPAVVWFSLTLGWPSLGGWCLAQDNAWSWWMLALCAANGGFCLHRGLSCWMKANPIGESDQ